jgi:predicted nucleic acid-binding protein
LKIVVDSWAWVEIIKLSAAGKAAKVEVERAEDVLTPAIVMAELARKYIREGTGQRTVRRWLQGIVEATEVYGIDTDLAIESALASVELAEKSKKEKVEPPGLGDALVLATARANQAQVLTGDPHFKGLPETVWLGD